MSLITIVKHLFRKREKVKPEEVRPSLSLKELEFKRRITKRTTPPDT